MKSAQIEGRGPYDADDVEHIISGVDVPLANGIGPEFFRDQLNEFVREFRRIEKRNARLTAGKSAELDRLKHAIGILEATKDALATLGIDRGGTSRIPSPHALDVLRLGVEFKREGPTRFDVSLRDQPGPDDEQISLAIEGVSSLADWAAHAALAFDDANTRRDSLLRRRKRKARGPDRDEAQHQFLANVLRLYLTAFDHPVKTQGAVAKAMKVYLEAVTPKVIGERSETWLTKQIAQFWEEFH
jgi:hypothetical protein